MNASDPWSGYTADPWGTPTPEPSEPDPATLEGLLELLDAQKQLLISVATDGPAIKTVDSKYKKRRKALNDGLRNRSIKPPFPFDDLWVWHGQWSSGDLPTYSSRRAYISSLAGPAREQLEAMLDGVQVSDPGGRPLETWGLLTFVLRASSTNSELPGPLNRPGMSGDLLV